MKIFAMLLLAAAISCGSVSAQQTDMQRRFEQRRSEMRKNFEQRSAEMSRNFEQRTGMKVSRPGSTSSSIQTYGSSTSLPRSTGSSTFTRSTARTNAGSSTASNSSFATSNAANSFSKVGSSPDTDVLLGTSLKPLPFNASQAPNPGLCFLKFVETAKSATSMEQLFPYLTYSEVKGLKQEHDQFNSANGGEEPYAQKLKFLKSIAGDIMRVRKSEIKGSNKAEVEVAIRSMHTASFNNGPMESFPYGRATAEMIGEGSYWKVGNYKDDGFGYKDPQ